MSSIKRSRTFATDAQSVRFLYLILKQLDLKSVNWQAVADGLGIKNGHAARMRWSRFKQHAEGDADEQRERPHSKKAGYDKGKGAKRLPEEDRQDLMMEDDFMSSKRVKVEYGYGPQTGFMQPSYSFHGNLSNPTTFLPPQPQFVKPEPNFQYDLNPFGDGLLPPTLQTRQGPSSSMRSSLVPYRNSAMVPGPASTWEDPDDRPIKQYLSSGRSTVSPPHLHINPLAGVQASRFNQLPNAQRNVDACDTPHPPPSTTGTTSHSLAQAVPSSKALQIQPTSRVTPNPGTVIKVPSPENLSTSSTTANASNPTTANASSNCDVRNSAEPVKIKQESEVIELSSPKVKVESEPISSTNLNDHATRESQEAPDLPQIGIDSLCATGEGEFKLSDEVTQNVPSSVHSFEVNHFRRSSSGAPTTEVRQPTVIQTTLLDFFSAKSTRRLSTSVPSPGPKSSQTSALPSEEQLQTTANTDEVPSLEEPTAEALDFEFHNLFPTSFQPFFCPADEMECEFDLDEMIRDLPCEGQEGETEVEGNKTGAGGQPSDSERDDSGDEVVIVA